ncbi:MAG: ABC transporter permease [Cellulosilyticaceae bacterium]
MMWNKLKQSQSLVIKLLILCCVLWVLIGYILMPTLRTVWLSFEDSGMLTLVHYQAFFENPANIKVMVNTLVMGLATVVVCGIVGTILAFVTTCVAFPLRGIFSKLLLTPVMVPGIIIVLAFIQLYGESGMVTKALQVMVGAEKPFITLTGFWGILFVHAYTQYVYFYMNVSVAIRHIDYSVIEAARNLGASRLHIFRTMIFPFIKPALIASSLVTFITGIGSFSAPSLIGDCYRTITTQMMFAKSNNRMDVASVQVVLLVVMAMVFLGVCRYYERKSAFVTSVKGTPMPMIKLQKGWTRSIVLGISVLLSLLILLPVVTIFVLSFVTPGSWLVDIFPKEYSWSNYIKIFTKSRAIAPFVNSIKMSLWAMIMGVGVALPCAYMIVRTKMKLKGVIEILAMLPLALPASAIAINLINAFNTPNVFAFNKSLIGGVLILPIAYFVGILPLILRSTTLAMYQFNETYEEASSSLGASSWQTFRKITFPLISPGIVSGALLGFIRCVGEYTSSAYLYGVRNKPIAIAMVNGVFEYEIGLAMAYGVLVIILTTVLSLVIQKIGDR